MTRSPIRVTTLLALAGMVFWAQPGALGERLPIHTYTIDDGLPSDDVQRIVRDSTGYLWFLTTRGLCRFDGQVVTTFGPEHGLPAGQPRDLLETSAGVFLVGTRNGVYWYDPHAPATEPMFAVARPALGGQGNVVNAFLEDGEGRLWCGTQRGLYRLARSAQGWDFDPVDLGRPADDILGNAIFHILEDRLGSLWLATAAGLIWRDRNGSVELLTHRDGLTPTSGLLCLAQDAEGRIWGGANDGLALMQPDPVTGRPVVLRIFGAKDGLLGRSGLAARFRDLLTTPGGDLWGAAFGLVRISPDPSSATAEFRVFDSSNGLSSPNLMALGEDLEGNLWVGTSDSGVMRLARGGFTSYGTEDGLSAGRAAVFLEHESGELRVITAERPRICTFDGRGFTEVEPLLPDDIVDIGWGSYQISFRDHLGEWWFGTFGGLFRFPRVSSVEELAVTRPRAHYTTRDGLLADGVFRVFEDSRGDLWIGTMHYTVPERNGLQRWDRATETFRTLGKAESVPRDSPTAFFEDTNGELWVGFYNRGLGRFRDGRFELFDAEQGAPQGYISQFHLDRAGRLWIATHCCGAVRVDRRNSARPEFVVHGKTHGLSTDSVYCITEDEWGRLYLGSDLGIDRYDPDTGSVTHFTRRDGLKDNWVRFAFRQQDGTLWFGTSQGVSRLNPEPGHTPYPSTVHVRSLRIAGVGRSLSPFGETDLSGFELSAGQRQVEVELSGLSFAAGERLRFQYLLSGAGETWSRPTVGRRIHFANLSPGRYKLQARAVDANGIVSPKPASISFRVFPPFWRRWWFLSGLILLAVGAGYAAHRFRLKRALELERVRTRIATDLHDDIGSSLSRVSILSEVVRRQVGDTFPGAADSLAQIADTARHLVDSMSDIVWAINPKRDRAADLVQRMRRFASDTFTGRNIAFRFDASPDGRERKLDLELRRQVYLIFKEAVNNAVRHSGCSKAEVRFHLEGKTLDLAVTDNGRGIADVQAGYGHGLTSMRDRARSLGGAFAVESAGGGGTAIRLQVPLRG